MKIGAFAKKNSISIDTVRHYMDLDLILPVKAQGQYDFDDRCQRQLTDIQTLKAMGFQLKEIKRIFLFKLLGKMTDYQKDSYYRMLFEEKSVAITDEIQRLETARERLKVKLMELDSQQETFHAIGVPLTALNVLVCPVCHGALRIKEGDIQDSQIIHGILSCDCGQTYGISEGVLMVESGVTYDGFSYSKDYVSRYINATDDDYLKSIYRRIDWMKRAYDFGELKGKTVLELGSGVGFALRNIFHLLPKDCLYIAVDHDLTRHRFLKRMFEGTDEHRQILFVCTDFKKLPLPEKSIDLLLDFTGTSNYSFDHRAFLLDEVIACVKDDSYLLGSYIVFRKFGKNSLIETRFRDNFRLPYIQEKLAELGYDKVCDEVSEPLYRGGIYENFFVEGEEVGSYQFKGRRWG